MAVRVSSASASVPPTRASGSAAWTASRRSVTMVRLPAEPGSACRVASSSVVAPLLLVATVLATYLAALGAAYLIFTRLAGMPALDNQVPLLSLLFLVALGVDYNIFLVTRVREETPALGTRPAIKVGVAVTGGVITSAGILLAAVFAVLGVLPLIVLTQIGVVVGIGVLLDTLLVRTVLVPALFALLGHRVWWPSALDSPHAAGGKHWVAA